MESVAMMGGVSTKTVRWLAGMAAAVLVAGAAVAARPAAMRAESVAAFHLHLLRSSPAADSTVASPAAVRLWFTESPELAVTSVRMTGPAGRAVRLGRLRADSAHSVVANVPARLSAGRYTLAWRTMSHDGHPMRGTIPFTVRATR
jgi:methionine-rich copper-binding protein CopC